MATKAKRVSTIVLMAIPSFVLIMGGIMKIIGKEPAMVMQFLSKAGFADTIKVLGVTELVIAALFIYPKTNKIGFLLAISYLSGAFALELSGGQPPASVVFLVILWVSMFLKDREMFLTGQTAEV